MTADICGGAWPLNDALVWAMIVAGIMTIGLGLYELMTNDVEKGELSAVTRAVAAMAVGIAIVCAGIVYGAMFNPC